MAPNMKNNFSGRAIAKIGREWGKRRFDWAARRILNTAPLRLTGESPLFISMVCHRDVIAYLIALKSLYVAIGQGRVIIINDGSLTADDLAILQRHIPGITTIEISTISTGACPKSGTWERLVKIVELSADNYVIQADADILVSAPIPEVVQCWQKNTSFLLGTGVPRDVASALDNAHMVQKWIKLHNWDPIPVGVEAEASLDTLPDAGQKSYVHASSGFAGFARGAFMMSELEWFSSHMRDTMGTKRWSEWGTEQIASNYILANAPGATVLPFPKYACFEPGLEASDYAFLHFIGTYRYIHGVYQRRVTKFIHEYAASDRNERSDWLESARN